ncbi:MAG TPA: hypothetical protein DCL29_06135 [Eubacterium sp.]|nr:hypothetical protein [Eubacterium sp.]
MNIKKKILFLLAVCIMCFMGVNAFADGLVVKETGVITSDNQVFKVKAPTKENGAYYYAYTPKENGVYQFSLTVDDDRYELSPALVTPAGDLKTFSVSEKGVATVKYTLRAGEKIYLGLIIRPSKEQEREVNVKLTVSRLESKAQIKILDNNYNGTEVLKDNVKGLSWDKKTSTLTINNYTGNLSNDLVIYTSEKESVNEVVFVDVKGTNTLKFTSGGILSDNNNIELEFIGDGELNFVYDKVNANGTAIWAEKVMIDGPSINIVGAFSNRCIYVGSFLMKSGTIYVDTYPYGKEEGYSAYTCIEAWSTITMENGTVIVKMEAPYDKTTIYGNNVLYAQNKVDILNGTIIITGSDKVLEGRGKIACANGEVNISKNVKIYRGSAIDISKFKLEVIDKKLEYDGKEKKARVNVEGLKIGRDIKVEYKNNIKPGKAEVIVTGIGNFKGTLKGYFEITPPVANGAAVGTVINDGQYKYKVTKAGSKNGVLIGKVSVVGLKKKSIKKIVIAKTVVIDGVTYNVVSIGKNAFKKNTKITSAKIGKNVVKIGTGAFSMCKNLKLVKTYSKKLKSIGYKAFFRCTKLKKVYVRSVKLKKVSKKAFAGTKYTLVVKVPKKMKKTYVKVFMGTGFTGLVK